MKNITKKLIGIGALSLMLSFPLKAQLSKQDSIMLNNFAIDYEKQEFKQINLNYNYERHPIFRDPAFYAGTIIIGTSLFNINYANNHYTLDERSKLIKTTTTVTIAGAVLSFTAYEISKKIINNRKKKHNARNRYNLY